MTSFKKNLLSQIKSPADIKSWDLPQLNQLAEELRKRITEVMAVRGGHLASNLGCIELTIALHKVFSSPDDKFIWDVGHQTYAHKLLTGRNDRFDRIRQFKGLCGFTHPQESEHDHFHAGHAGTALSLALGVLKNRELSKRQDHIIPVIGDASLTCGLTLEALNNIQKDFSRFVVILNDNEMSISENVGAIKSILSRLLNNPIADKFYHDIESLLSKIPGYGSKLANTGNRVTDSMRGLVSDAGFFGEFGLSYVGPIDGHDIEKLIAVFEAVKNTDHPIIVHVLTKKGKGMEEAMKNPTGYHGAKPFDLETGKFISSSSSKSTFPQVFGKHLLKLADNDPSLVAVTPAMSAGSCLDAFMKKFPERCIDVGIAEGHAVTYAGGIAYGGHMKVVASVYATFLQRALDNLFHDVCLQELPVIFALDRAGLSSHDGATHHGIYDIAFLNAMPNMIISQPRNGHVLKELLESSFTWKRPAAIRYPNMSCEESQDPITHRSPGIAEVLHEGQDLLLIGLGHMCQVAQQVRELLIPHGIFATVVDPVFIKPLDSELLCRLLVEHKKIVSIEEHAASSGLGAILNHFLLSHGFSEISTLNFGIPDTFVQQGTYQELMDELGLTAEKIAKKILSELYSNNQTKRSAITNKAT